MREKLLQASQRLANRLQNVDALRQGLLDANAQLTNSSADALTELEQATLLPELLELSIAKGLSAEVAIEGVGVLTVKREESYRRFEKRAEEVSIDLKGPSGDNLVSGHLRRYEAIDGQSNSLKVSYGDSSIRGYITKGSDGYSASVSEQEKTANEPLEPGLSIMTEEAGSTKITTRRRSQAFDINGNPINS